MLHQIDAAATAAAPTFDDVREAARTLAGLAVRPPLPASPALNHRVGGRVLLNAEPLQRPVYFRFYGSPNRIPRLPAPERPQALRAPFHHRQRTAQSTRGTM